MKSFLMFFLILFSVGTSAQSKVQNDKSSEKPSVKVQGSNEENKNAGNSENSAVADKTVREKDPYSKNQKAGPAIFYVEDDKPVDKPNWKKKKI